MKNLLRATGIVGALAVVLAGCTKEPLNNLSEAESRIYITNHDNTASFSSYKTFSIADSVAVIENNRLVEKSRSSLAIAFIDAVTKAMQDRGFTLVSKDQHPDLGMSVNVISNTGTQVVSYPDYWNDYYGYWDPYYWGYPGYGYYGGYVGVYQVQENALTVDMLDLRNAPANNQIKSVWSGLIRGSGIFNNNSVNSQVQALFDQSPYLTTNQ